MGEDPNNDLVEHVYTVSLKSKHGGPVTEDFIAKDYHRGTGGKSPMPAWSTDSRLDFQHVTTHMLAWQNIVLKLRLPPEKELLDAGYENAWIFKPPIVDSPKMIQVRKTAFVVLRRPVGPANAGQSVIDLTIDLGRPTNVVADE